MPRRKAGTALGAWDFESTEVAEGTERKVKTGGR